MDIKEIKLADFHPEKFTAEKEEEIKSLVGKGAAINALSGGVDSSAVTMLGHKALGLQIKTYFVENGLMRRGEADLIVNVFKELGVKVEVVDAKKEFFGALKGLTDPEEKREAITQTFYKNIFGRLVRETGAKFLFQGTNYTDVEETVAGIKRQHNILEQLGIDTQARFGYKVLEPIIQLRKSGVRELARFLGLPAGICLRPPFPGPALSARVIGEVTPERVEIVRSATEIVEEKLTGAGAFQYMAILHQDRVTGIRDGKRDYGLQIEVRCWQSKDALLAQPTKLPFEVLEDLAEKITTGVPGVVSVTYNITKKPPSTMEAI